MNKEYFNYALKLRKYITSYNKNKNNIKFISYINNINDNDIKPK